MWLASTRGMRIKRIAHGNNMCERIGNKDSIDWILLKLGHY